MKNCVKKCHKIQVHKSKNATSEEKSTPFGMLASGKASRIGPTCAGGSQP